MCRKFSHVDVMKWKCFNSTLLILYKGNRLVIHIMVQFISNVYPRKYMIEVCSCDDFCANSISLNTSLWGTTGTCNEYLMMPFAWPSPGHEDVTGKHSPHYWPFVRGSHQWWIPLTKGQQYVALIFSLNKLLNKRWQSSFQWFEILWMALLYCLDIMVYL